MTLAEDGQTNPAQPAANCRACGCRRTRRGRCGALRALSTGTARRAPRRGGTSPRYTRARRSGVCVKAYSSVGNWLMTLDDATKVAYGVDAMLWIDLEGFAGCHADVAACRGTTSC